MVVPVTNYLFNILSQQRDTGISDVICGTKDTFCIIVSNKFMTRNTSIHRDKEEGLQSTLYPLRYNQPREVLQESLQVLPTKPRVVDD